MVQLSKDQILVRESFSAIDQHLPYCCYCCFFVKTTVKLLLVCPRKCGVVQENLVYRFTLKSYYISDLNKC